VTTASPKAHATPPLILVERDASAPERATAIEATVEWRGEVVSVTARHVAKNIRFSSLGLPLELPGDPVIAELDRSGALSLLLPDGARVPDDARCVLRAGALRVTLARVGSEEAEAARAAPAVERRIWLIAASGAAHVAMLALAAHVALGAPKPDAGAAVEAALHAQIVAALAADGGDDLSSFTDRGVGPGAPEADAPATTPGAPPVDVIATRDMAALDAPDVLDVPSGPASPIAPRAPSSAQLPYIALNAANVRLRPSRAKTMGS
jgi:hypothetical protein